MEKNSNKCPVCHTEFSEQEKREIVINNINKINNFKINCEKLNEENKNLRIHIEELNQKIQELQEQLIKYDSPDDSVVQYNDVEIQELLQKLKHPLVIEAIKNIIHNHVESQDNSISNQVGEDLKNQNVDEIITDDVENNSPESDTAITLHEQELVKNYQDSNFDFQQFIIRVSEPEQSQTNRWGGSKEATSFKYNRQGNYWIVNMDNGLYIVPQKKFKINEYSQETLTSTFDCRNYQPGKSEDFVLIKPGKVIAISAEEWQLVERGILHF